ncbi:MAG: 50S ribosomal protein L6 [Helicobacteraceae bacterium]|jgi:large subunit ribosomal protein L6|nr:50S ribosomal protein L6 [Helicobacteraceae bacterium]
MSRIGKMPVVLPKGVEAKINGNIIEFKGAKLTKTLDTLGNVQITLEEGKLYFKPKDEAKQSRAFWGTYRALAGNIVQGLSKGFEKNLEISGVGYRASVKGKTLELLLGYSHPINYEIPEGVEISVDKNVSVSIKGADKQQVGQVAAIIRDYRGPEPYKGKGVRYADETILRKAGKTAKK